MTAGLQRTVGSVGADEFRAASRGDGVGIRIGPFDAHVRLRVDGLEELLHRFYQDYPLLEGPRVFHFHVSLTDRWRLLPRPSRQVRFSVDGRVPHEDMPRAHALAVLEWGFNLVIAMRYSRYLMLHSAALERSGRVMLLPAAPGSGKTTLCTALAHRGWRLFSDEFGLVRPETTTLVPVPRPMPLKNESIPVIRAYLPEADIGPEIPGTRKGTVAHVRVPAASVARAAEEAPPGWLVFPRWVAGAPLSLTEVPKAEGFMRLATNAFNYDLHGERGFESLKSLVDRSRCFRLEYSDLDEAIAALGEMADCDGR